MLFDEIEKASDALWNLLLGILDKATLTLGDNRRVDFGRAMIFMTSNLGAAEMGSILRPNLGFACSEVERQRAGGQMEDGMTDKISRAGVEAARKKFTPEFMNRIDKTVVFKPLGECELRKILGLELNILQQRIFNSPSGAPFVFSRDRRGPGSTAARRHGYEIRRPSSEAGHRSFAGASAIESDRYGPDPRRRSDPGGFRLAHRSG